jgi:hypothetical protein
MHFSCIAAKKKGILKMSVTTFIKLPETNAFLSQRFHLPRFSLTPNLPMIPPRTKHYSLIGTSFDYLLRFVLKHTYPQAKTQSFVAENVSDGLTVFDRDVVSVNYIGASLILKYGESTTIKVCDTVQASLKIYESYLENGQLSNEVLRASILLAQTDYFFRSGMLFEPYGEVDDQDISDLRSLYTAVPFDTLTPKALCLLNPTFGASGRIGGADVDLVIDTAMIDIKTVQALKITRDQLNQLIVYYLLIRLDGVHGASANYKPDRLGIYFSRYGYLHSFPVYDLASEAVYQEATKWLDKALPRSK